MPTSSDTFVQSLTASGLMTRQTLERLLSAIPAGERPQDGESLARWLVEQRHLTPYQATQVYRGNIGRLVLDNYVILDELGTGGMGQVFKAEHQRMKRTVALKVLPENVSQDPKLVARFQREMQAAARLMHPNIVTAFDADEAEGVFFLVMEYVPGKDLATLVRRHGPLPVHQAIGCALDAARGLEYAHRHGVTHRDVKPANLMLSTDTGPHAAGRVREHLGSVKILDLGVARIEGTAEGAATQAELTGTGMVIGTVDYMAPEQALETRDADHRSDVYSLGMTLYFLLTGKPAYSGDSAMQRFVSHRESPIPSLSDVVASLPPGLDAIFTKMVAKRPQDRYQSMSEVVAALEDLQSRLSDPIPGDVTAVAVTKDDDTAMRVFLQVVDAGGADRESSAETATDLQASETAVSRKAPTWTAPDTTTPDHRPPRTISSKWLWPLAACGGGLALLLLLISTGPEHEEPPDAGTAIDAHTPPDSGDVGATATSKATTQRFALQFDKPDAWVLVPALPLDLSQPFVWEVWCRPQEQHRTNNVGRFVGQLGPVQLKIWKDRWQSPIVDLASGGSSGVFLESPREPDSPAHVHVAFQWTGRQPQLFVDGKLVPEQLGQFNLHESPDDFVQRLFVGDAPIALKLGNFEYGDEQPPEDSGEFAGTIDAVRISHGVRYQDAFDPTDFVADAQTVALYDFHEGSGDVLHDVSGHGHDGTIHDATWRAPGSN